MHIEEFRCLSRMERKKIGKLFMSLRTRDFLEGLEKLVKEEQKEGIQKAKEELEKEIEDYGNLSLKEMLKRVLNGKNSEQLEESVIRAVYLIPAMMVEKAYYEA